MPYWLKLILNSDQGLALLKQKQILTGLLVTKIYKKKKNNDDLFIQLLYAWLHLIATEEILFQPIF